jgi:hypothetical protein
VQAASRGARLERRGGREWRMEVAVQPGLGGMGGGREDWHAGAAC